MEVAIGGSRVDKGSVYEPRVFFWDTMPEKRSKTYCIILYINISTAQGGGGSFQT